MLIDNLNINSLRVFQVVYRLENMSLAAKEMGLTQSGVSQHIKNLEFFLGRPLFERYKRRLIPLSLAKHLYKSCENSFGALESIISNIVDEEVELDFTLKIGIPIEFGNNILIPKLQKLYQSYPKLKFHFLYGYAVDMNRLLLSGDIHFAFVDDFAMDPQINTKVVFNEELRLCAHKDYLKDKGEFKRSKEYFESLEYLSYVEDTFVVRRWFETHYNFKKLNLEFRAQLMDVQGVATMISNKMGVGVLPLHFAKELKGITYFESEKKSYLNPIRLAWSQKRVEGPELGLIFQELLNLFA